MHGNVRFFILQLDAKVTASFSQGPCCFWEYRIRKNGVEGKMHHVWFLLGVWDGSARLHDSRGVAVVVRRSLDRFSATRVECR